MNTNSYESPFCTRYASKEMQYLFSADKKFTTWRRLWVALARAEMKLGLPVTQRAYLLGHSVETNERFYSHMKTESLVNLKDVLNRASHTNDAQSESIHTHTHTKIVFWTNKKLRNTHKY